MLTQAPPKNAATPAAQALDRHAPPFGRPSDGTLTASGEAWLYTMLPMEPLAWDGPARRGAHARRLDAMLTELAADHGREFHLLWLAWDEAAAAPAETHPRLREWLDPIFAQFSCGTGLFAAGVRLRQPRSRILGRVCGRRAAQRDADRELVQQIFARVGGLAPSDTQITRMESWWNNGAGRGGVLDDGHDDHTVGCDAFPEGLTFSAATDFEHFEPDFAAGGWLADAAAGDGCVAVSARGSLQPAPTPRAVADAAACGDYLETRPVARDCSVLLAHRASNAMEQRLSPLEQVWGVKCGQITGDERIQALAETLPLGRPRVRTFTAPRETITASGIGAYNDVGDRSGLWVGTAMPERPTVWLDPAAASQQSAPPVMGVFGEPGSGKTTMLQLVADQAARCGLPVVYINPNAADSLTGFADSVNGDTVKLTTLTGTVGMLDPFRHATAPGHAAALAISHIETAIPSLSDRDRVALTVAIRQAAADGASCVGEALTHEDVPAPIAETVRLLALSDPLFGLGVSHQPLDPWSFATAGRVTLVEFDLPVYLPAAWQYPAELTSTQRSAIAALRLVAGVALEQIIAAGGGLGPRDGPGGVLIVDEALTVLAGGGASSILERIDHVGPNHAILPIMATQNAASLIEHTPTPGLWLGRGLTLGYTNPAQADAALRLCRMEPTASRRSFLKQARPVFDRRSRTHDRGALGLLRDLNADTSALLVGPLPERTRRLYCAEPPSR